MISVPALSTPVRVGSDEHLTTVVCVGVVHVQFQLFPIMGFNKGKQILALFREQSYTVL